MKKTILSIFAGLATILTLSAQIPNAGFENWTTMGSYETPDSWGTMNNTTASSSVYTATKGTPGNVGAAYLKLVSKTVGSTVVNGIAVSGVLDSITLTPISGFPYSERPNAFTGKWQHMLSGSSAGSVSVLLTRWNTSLGVRETVATANQTLSGMVMSWGNFSINFTYQSTETPDTCIIVLKASGASPTNGDYLYVDNLAFSGSATSINKNESSFNGLIIFPNPASGSLNLKINAASNQMVRVELMDLTGKLILTENAIISPDGSASSIDIEHIASGTYLLKISNETQFDIQKIVIQ
jgi:hypothetical protein